MEHQSNGDSKLSVIIFTTLFNIITQNLNRQSMKKIIILLAAVMTTVGINAQSDYNNEISVAYGAGANTDISMAVGRGIFTAKQTKYWGPASLEYFHSIGKNWKIGGIAMVSGCKWEGEGNPKSTYYTIMPAAKYNWLNQRGFGMYSKAGLGVTNPTTITKRQEQPSTGKCLLSVSSLAVLSVVSSNWDLASRVSDLPEYATSSKFYGRNSTANSS